MIQTNSQNFMPDRPWPGLTTTALPAAVSQGGSDKYATEAHKTTKNEQKQAACDRPQAVVPWALRSRNQLPRCGQPGSNNRPHNPKRTQNLSNPHLSLSSSSSLLPYLPPVMQLLYLMAPHSLFTLCPLKTTKAKKPPRIVS
uniref:Uncharacterized protein n=1 Tax=Trichobilharzia regenti TaxID=157069 RepID=A0AA85JW18_TRIRE|nr:unnamed protein product [Trichobilharzia regenti]